MKHYRDLALVELLVVIAIVALLLLPAVQGVRETALRGGGFRA